MEQPAWNQDLLDWLAEDLVAHRYDLKQTMAVILTSNAYQREAVDAIDRSAGRTSSRAGGQAPDGRAVRRCHRARSPASGRRSAAGKFDFALVSAHARPVAGRTRASLVASNPLMAALGRPNREQVVTARSTRGDDAAGTGALERRDAGSGTARGRGRARRVDAARHGRDGEPAVRPGACRGARRRPSARSRSNGSGRRSMRPGSRICCGAS